MFNQQQLESIFLKYGFDDFKWASGKDVKVAQWVRFKCMYGCDSFGERSACPPNTPSVSDCSQFFSEYERIAIFHFGKNQEAAEQLAQWGKATNNRQCKNKKMARPCIEALALDVYGTVRSIGYPIKVIENDREEMNRYAILLIE